MTGITIKSHKSQKEKELTLDEILQNVGVGLWSYIIFAAASISEYLHQAGLSRLRAWYLVCRVGADRRGVGK